MQMQEYRGEIDRIDKELTALVQKRLHTAGAIGRLKKEAGMPVEDVSREQEVLRRVRALSDRELEEYVVALYREILRLSREYQKGDF